MNKSLIMVVTAVFLGGMLRAESAVYALDGKMIFSESGNIVMGAEAALQALKDLGVSGKDATTLTRFIVNDQKRLEEIQRLGLPALSRRLQDMRSPQSDEARGRSKETTSSMRASSHSTRPKSPVAAARRSPSPVGVDWERLDAFMRDHADNPIKALKHLSDTDPRAVKQLCYAILDRDFYGKAETAGIGTIKKSTMVGFCNDYLPERSRVKDVKQRSRSASPVREKVVLRPVVFPKQSESLAAQQQGLENARAIILENADRLGTRAATEERLKGVNTRLKRAQERYDNLTAVVIGMKEDLGEVKGFEEFSRRRKGDMPEVYINHLVSFLDNEGSQLVLEGETKGQIPIAHELVAQAKDNLADARYDLEQINREMLQFTK